MAKITLGSSAVSNNLSSDSVRVSTGGDWAGSQALVKNDETEVLLKTDGGWGSLESSDVLPTYTTTERDALSGPSNGLLIYNSTSHEVQARINGAWATLSTE